MGDDVRDEIERIGRGVQARFDAEKRVLSFQEYLALVRDEPARHTRDAARYLLDCIDHFGSYTVARPTGKVRRYRLFDLPFEAAEGGERRRRSDHLVGHEAIQEAFRRTLVGFAREGRANRLILLHGPNGSAKSTFAACLMKGLEAYSAVPEGALYRFSWIFPRGQDGKRLGFGSSDGGPGPGESYAHFPETRVDVKLTSPLREHPLLLLPRDERRDFMRGCYERASLPGGAPATLADGGLGHENQQIFEALLTAYRGDLARVLGHVQVERFYISRRYRRGAVTIGPEMAVDAAERQITADRSLGSLPASLSALTLFEPVGSLVDGERGLVEYSDLLKRPLDAWRYLLLAIENGEVSLSQSILPVDAVLMASSNELHLSAFKDHPEYRSFRGRLVLVRVPYLIDYRQEQAIYDAQLVPQIQMHVAPHATYVAALWAVLSRLRPAEVGHFVDKALGRVAASLTPIEKAELYADGTIPDRLDPEEEKALASGVAEVYAELASAAAFEGGTGASPREVRLLLMGAASDPDAECLSPLAVLDRLRAFCGRDDYDFLRQDVERGYHDHLGFVELVRNRWLDRVEGELRDCTGLVEERRYFDLFQRYVTHVSHSVKKEKVLNPVTGGFEDPDLELMERVEGMLEVDGGDDFRDGLLAAIAGYAIDHPDEEVDYARVFPRHIARLKQAYFIERHQQLGAIARDVLHLIGDEEDLPGDRRVVAARTLESMIERYGYERSSVKVAVAELLSDRHAT